MVSEYLGGAGFDISRVASGAAALERLARQPYDALVLDLNLPDIDGLEVCRRLRAKWDTPVLMLTARGEPMDRVVGLELGADDYLPKPFEPRELLARLRALLRRAHAPARSNLMRFGRLEIDRDSRLVRVDGEERTLTSLQYEPAVARRAHGPGERPAARGVRSLHRRARLAHSRRDRGRSEEAAPPDHRAWRGLRLRKAAALMRRLSLRIYLAVLGSLAAR